jgi:hypothetical protein
MSDKFRDGLPEKDQQWLDAIREHNAAERAMRLERESPPVLRVRVGRRLARFLVAAGARPAPVTTRTETEENDR